MSEASINNEISNEGIMKIINEEKEYRELKESIRMMNSQRGDTEKIDLIGEGRKTDIDKVINNTLKSKI